MNVRINVHHVMGNVPRVVLLVINRLNRRGSRVNVIKTTERMPITDMVAMDSKAGCRAKMSTPIPAIVVSTEKKMDVL